MSTGIGVLTALLLVLLPTAAVQSGDLDAL